MGSRVSGSVSGAMAKLALRRLSACPCACAAWVTFYVLSLFLGLSSLSFLSLFFFLGFGDDINIDAGLFRTECAVSEGMDWAETESDGFAASSIRVSAEVSNAT